MTQVSLIDYATAAHFQDAKARWLMPGLVRMRNHAGFLQPNNCRRRQRDDRRSNSIELRELILAAVTTKAPAGPLLYLVASGVPFSSAHVAPP